MSVPATQNSITAKVFRKLAFFCTFLHESATLQNDEF